MGRETKILLALLGLLAGTFVGVLSQKLLVPRPPLGAGPDVRADFDADPSHNLVEPPTFSAAPPPLPLAAVPSRPLVPEAAPQPAGERPTGRSFGPRIEDPFVAPSALDSPAAQPAVQPAFEPEVPRAELPAGRDSRSRLATDAPVAATPPAAPAAVPTGDRAETLVPGGAYVTVAGDSWWSLAERAYGDGRLYRALFAWNRAIDPRVSLVPGTQLEVPARRRLEESWPRLVPGP